MPIGDLAPMADPLATTVPFVSSPFPNPQTLMGSLCDQLWILPCPWSCPWSCPWNVALPGLPLLSPNREEPRPGLPESPERLLVAWLEKWKQMKLTDKCPGLWQRPLTGGRLAVGGLMETDPDGSGMRRWITLMELRRGRMLRRHYSKIIWFLFVFLWGGGEGCGAPQSVEFFPKQIC